MKILCATTEQLYEAIEQLVKKGLMFEACVDDLTIHLTGGF